MTLKTVKTTPWRGFFFIFYSIVGIAMLLLNYVYAEQLVHYLVMTNIDWRTSEILICLHSSILVLSVFSVVLINHGSGKLNIILSGTNLLLSIWLLSFYGRINNFQSFQGLIIAYGLLAFIQLTLVLWSNKNSHSKKLKMSHQVIFNFVALIASVLISVGINRPYVDDYEWKDTFQNQPVDISTNLNQNNLIPEEVKRSGLVVIVSTTCNNCTEIIGKLEAEYRSGGLPENTYVIVGGTTEHLNDFLKKTELSIPWDRTEDQEWFGQISGGSVPRVLYLQNQKVVRAWNVLSLNYAALDFLDEL